MTPNSLPVLSWKIKHWGHRLFTLLFLSFILQVGISPSIGYRAVAQDYDDEEYVDEDYPAEEFDDPSQLDNEISLENESSPSEPPPMGDEEDPSIQWEDENDYFANENEEIYDPDQAQDYVEKDGQRSTPEAETLEEEFDELVEQDYQDEFADEQQEPSQETAPFEFEDDVYSENEAFIEVPEEDFDDDVVQFEDDDILLKEGQFVNYESPLPPIAARTFALKLDRKSRSGNVYLFQDVEDALPKEGRLLLLRQGTENAMAFRVLKRYSNEQKVAAAKVRQYDFGDLAQGSTYTGIEKLGNLAVPSSKQPQLDEDMRELEEDMGLVDDRDFEDQDDNTAELPSSFDEEEVAELPEEENQNEAAIEDPMDEGDEYLDLAERDDDEAVTLEDDPYAPLTMDDLEYDEFDSYADDPYEFEDSQLANQDAIDQEYLEDEAYSEQYYGDYADQTGAANGLDDKDYDELPREGPGEDEYVDYVVTNEGDPPLNDDETEDDYQDFVEWDPEAQAEEDPDRAEAFEVVRNPNNNPGLINADILEEVALNRSDGPENLILTEKTLLSSEDKNWLTGTAGALQARGIAGGLTYFTGGGVRYGRDFKTNLFTRVFNREDSLSWEASLLFFKVLTYEQANDSYSVVPLVGTVRYNLKMNEFLTLYAYGGLLRNFVIAAFNSSNDTSNARTQLNSIGIAGGAGALLTIGPKWHLRANLGIDAVSAGLVVKF